MTGSLLPFCFGVPNYPEKSRAGHINLIGEQEDPDEKGRVRRADWLSEGGAQLLALGFVFQFASLLCD